MKEKIDEVKEWIYQADRDLGSSKVIYCNMPKYFETIAFHCQQAVEKYIKGLLIFFDINFKRTHDIVYLIDLLSEKIEIPDVLFSKALSLEGFGVDVRYPNHKIFLTKEELADIIRITGEFREFVIKNIDFEIESTELEGI